MGKLRHSWGGSSCASRVGTVTRNPKILELGSCRSNPFLKIPSLGDPTAARSSYVLSLSRCLVQLKAAGNFRDRRQLQPSASGRDPIPGLPKTHRLSPAASRQRCLRSRPVGFNQLGSPLSYFFLFKPGEISFSGNGNPTPAPLPSWGISGIIKSPTLRGVGSRGGILPPGTSRLRGGFFILPRSSGRRWGT